MTLTKVKVVARVQTDHRISNTHHHPHDSWFYNALILVYEGSSSTCIPLDSASPSHRLSTRPTHLLNKRHSSSQKPSDQLTHLESSEIPHNKNHEAIPILNPPSPQSQNLVSLYPENDLAHLGRAGETASVPMRREDGP